MEEMGHVYNILVGSVKGRDHWEDIGIVGRIILGYGS
jgi:hypothetical protein